MPSEEVRQHILDAAVIALEAHPDRPHLAFHFSGGDDSGSIESIYLSTNYSAWGGSPSPVTSMKVEGDLEESLLHPLWALLSMEFGSFCSDGTTWEGWIWLDFEKGAIAHAEIDERSSHTYVAAFLVADQD